jgi:hypothetical protein
MDMRKLITLVEDKALKTQIVAAIKHVDDPVLLNRVLRTLKEGNIEERIRLVLGKDSSAARYIDQVARAVLSVDAPLEDVERFLVAFPKGVIDPTLLTDGQLHSFLELSKNNQFVASVFKNLCTLTPQGVGPGELAIAILSPEVKHVGTSGGGGDVIVGKTPVEIKGSNVGGGRWSDAKKAKMDMAGTARAIKDALAKSDAALEIPDYLGLDFWCETLRPAIKPNLLGPLCKTIASNLFSQVPSDDLATALQMSNATQIKRVYVKVNFENYKKYAKFQGLMLLDVNAEQFQYFESFDQMNGDIKVGTPYLCAPERDVTPQIELSPGAGAIQVGRFSLNPKKELSGSNDKELQTAAYNFAAKICDDRMITDQDKINAIALDLMISMQSGMKKDAIFKELLDNYPELNKPAVKSKAAPAAAPAPAIPSVTQPNTAPASGLAPVPGQMPLPTAPLGAPNANIGRAQRQPENTIDRPKR